MRLLKEAVLYYDKDNAEIIGILERPLIEASVVATYLMTQGPEVMLDYRKCSYKDRLRIIREMEEGSRFFDTKAGQRLFRSVQEKLEIEGFSKDDFVDQKKNRWKLQGKSFYDIFAQIHEEDLYACTYGMMSDSIHGSWNESLDWCLSREADGTYRPILSSYPADIRFVTTTLQFTNEPLKLWLQRINCYDSNIRGVLDWIDKVNATLFVKFDELFDE